MGTTTDTTGSADQLKCPECRAALKRRRSRTADQCEMICGGCGQIFDVCDPDSSAALRKAAT